MKSLRAVWLFLSAWAFCFATAHAQITDDLDLVGESGWRKSGNGIRISAERIENNRPAGTSGFLRLQIWATTNVYDGVSDITGYVLGTFNLDVLPVDFIFANVSSTVRYNKPPPGLYYTTITLEENTIEGYAIADSENFEGLVNLGGFGQGSAFFANGNGDVSFVEDISWLAGNGRANLFAGKILNERTTRTGNLRVRLWATSTPYQGEDILQGFPMATKRVDRVLPESFIPNFSTSTPFRSPPVGEYYVTMTLEEYFRGWNIVDYVTFEGTSIF